MLLKLNADLFIETKAITDIDFAAEIKPRSEVIGFRVLVGLTSGRTYGFKQDSPEAAILRSYVAGATGGRPFTEHLSPAGLAQYERTGVLPTRNAIEA